MKAWHLLNISLSALLWCKSANAQCTTVYLDVHCTLIRESTDIVCRVMLLCNIFVMHSVYKYVGGCYVVNDTNGLDHYKTSLICKLWVFPKHIVFYKNCVVQKCTQYFVYSVNTRWRFQFKSKNPYNGLYTSLLPNLQPADHPQICQIV